MRTAPSSETPSVSLQKVPGFESTAYAYLNGALVWTGTDAVSAHPRHAAHPWFPELRVYDAARLKSGARTCLEMMVSRQPPFTDATGLLLWLTGRPMTFPLSHARNRFDSARAALEAQDLQAFETAALRLLGVGVGLTPSGDDFVGGVFFAFSHASVPAWTPGLETTKARLRAAAHSATNPISAALLGDLIDGVSHRALHEMLDAFVSGSALKMKASYAEIMRIGATSGADMLTGLVLALSTLNSKR